MDMSRPPSFAPGGGIGATSAVRPQGVLKSKIGSLNRLGNMLSEDVHNISMELDRISGVVPSDPSKCAAERPCANEIDEFQEQLECLDRLAQFAHGQLERLRSL